MILIIQRRQSNEGIHPRNTIAGATSNDSYSQLSRQNFPAKKLPGQQISNGAPGEKFCHTVV
jgi:hypothetical protein